MARVQRPRWSHAKSPVLLPAERSQDLSEAVSSAGTAFLRAFGPRKPAIVAVQLLLLVIANFAAFTLRFDGDIPEQAKNALVVGAPIVLGVRALSLAQFRLFGGLWRYSGIWDLRNLVISMLLGTAVLAIALPLIVPAYPRSVLVIEGILGVFALGGLRLARRAYRERLSQLGPRRILIFGGGDAGATVAREMRQNLAHGMRPIGFIDDDPAKRGGNIDGVPVLGTRQELAAVASRVQPDEILIAVPRATSAQLRPILAELGALNLPVRILPSLEARLDRRASLVDRARPLAIEDLLRRDPVALDAAALDPLIRGRTVLVTGAGGSIGSELCRQIASLGPALLIMLDRYENGLYEIDQSLLRSHNSVRRLPLIGDIADRPRIENVFRTYRPEIIFHAAAHKHVPLMELSPSEAVKNNVRGTRIVAEAALAFHASRFILISSDKAVNPSSVMGATKRVAERMIQTLGDRSPSTVFAAVRFGNVLGSNGSVVPLFRHQIQNGGPVTVTHPDMRRFFMLIPEAVQLVLHAAAMAGQGEIYVLDMGEQIKVVDVARDLVRLSARRRSDADIRIEFVGLRPGEKLYEERVGSDEVVESSSVQRIDTVRPAVGSCTLAIEGLVSQLEAAAVASADELVLTLIKDIVPTFREISEPEAATA